MSLSSQQYAVRRDIQGLRALAILAVIANHALPSALPGGFCGVDVFFVLSGYLIGKHLLESIQVGQLSFAKFYARRARRLFPALIVVLAAVWGFGWIILSGPEFESLGRHVAAASVFANNFLLQSESGYFDTAAASKPLLHLWSLGVEEQFYLLVPVLLWLGSRNRTASIAWVARLAVLSLLLTECATYPAFFLLDSRFWELGAGVALGYLSLHGGALLRGSAALRRSTYIEVSVGACAVMFASVLPLEAKLPRHGDFLMLAYCGLILTLILAIGFIYLLGIYRRAEHWGQLASKWRRHETTIRLALAVSGAALLGVSFVALTPANWPGPQTMLPVLGTVLVIAAGDATGVNAALGSRPLVFVGDISYPLYLWHWPLLVYGKMLGPDRGISGTLISLCAAFLLSWLTKQLVEDPARWGRLRGRPVTRPPTWVTTSGLLAAGLIGVATVTSQGFPARFPRSLQAVASWSLPYPDTAWRVGRCYIYPGPMRPFAAECTPAKRSGVLRMLLWGDSHAAQLYPGLVALRARHDFDLIQWTASGCPPTRSRWLAEELGCEPRREWIMNEMRGAQPDTVLMAARWELYRERGISDAEILAALTDDVRWLHGLGVRRIVVFGPGPAWNASLPTDLFRYMSLHRTGRVPERLGSIPTAEQHLDRLMAAQAVAAGAQYVSVLDWFCNTAGCRTTGNETLMTPDLLFRDQDHLTPSGSRDLIGSVATVLLSN
jgi:peptidoglycan/LPS O-acetylase OafA/YrhL